MVANSHGGHLEGTGNGFHLASADELQIGENTPFGGADQRRFVHVLILVGVGGFDNLEFGKVNVDKLSDQP